MVDPVGIVRLGGTVSEGLLLERAMLIVPVAALFNEIVQVVDALLPSEVGEQDIDESCGGALALSVKFCEAPLREAVRIAV